MARRRTSGADSQNLDSLLDTMSNVVGILIVLVAVTQLTVGDALERIRVSDVPDPPITSDDVARVESEQAGLSDELEDLEVRWQAAKSLGASGRRELADAEEMIAQLQAQSADPSLIGLGAGELAELARERGDGIARLERQLAAREATFANLNVVLRDAPPDTTPQVVRLPDPRPPPPNMHPAYFFCRFGRCTVFPLAQIEDAMFEGVRLAVGAPASKVVVEPSDVPWIVNHFAKQNVGVDPFRISFERSPSGMTGRIGWMRKDSGETANEIRSGGSSVERALERVTPATHFLQFVVWSDSYEAYLEARALGDSRGYYAGWDVEDASYELTFNPFDRRDTRSMLRID